MYEGGEGEGDVSGALSVTAIIGMRLNGKLGDVWAQQYIYSTETAIACQSNDRRIHTKRSCKKKHIILLGFIAFKKNYFFSHLHNTFGYYFLRLDFLEGRGELLPYPSTTRALIENSFASGRKNWEKCSKVLKMANVNWNKCTSQTQNRQN